MIASSLVLLEYCPRLYCVRKMTLHNNISYASPLWEKRLFRPRRLREFHKNYTYPWRPYQRHVPWSMKRDLKTQLQNIISDTYRSSHPLGTENQTATLRIQLYYRRGAEGCWHWQTQARGCPWRYRVHLLVLRMPPFLSARYSVVSAVRKLY